MIVLRHQGGVGLLPPRASLRRGRSPPPSGFIEAARWAPSPRHRLVANRQSHQPAEGRKLASILIHDSQEDGWQTVVRKRSIMRLLRLRATSPGHLTQDCRCPPRGLWSFHPPSSAPVASSATSARPSSGSAVCFSYYDDMFRVLHEPPLAPMSFNLIFKRWRRQLHASADNLFYQVTVSGVPAHTRQLATARQILGKSCSNLRPSPSMAEGHDLRTYRVDGWCIQLDLIPRRRSSLSRSRS
jgi:hypothetical protein